MSCRSRLRWYELIPLISFVVLWGRCKNCKTKISAQYPLVEFITGLIFACLFLKFRNVFYYNTLLFTLTYAYYAIMFSLLIIVAAYDLRHKIIPDALSLIFGVLAFAGLFLFAGSSFLLHVPTILEFLSGLLIGLPFALLWIISGGTWMGLGDAKLALGLGWFLGLAKALPALLIAFWSGAIIGIMFVILRKGYGMKSEIPFAPYLIFGASLAFFFDLHFLRI